MDTLVTFMSGFFSYNRIKGPKFSCFNAAGGVKDLGMACEAMRAGHHTSFHLIYPPHPAAIVNRTGPLSWIRTGGDHVF